MVVLWGLDAALTLASWFLLLFSALPLLTLPSGASLTFPLPFVGSTFVSQVNAFVPIAVSVSVALVGGRVLQWFYALIPFKGT